MVQGNEVEFVTKSGIFLAKKILEHKNDDELSEKHHNNNTPKFLIQLSFPLYLAVPLDPSEMKFFPTSLKNPSMMNIMKMTAENDLIVS